MRLFWLPIRFLAVVVPLGVVALAGCQAINFYDQTLDEPVPAAVEPPRELSMRSLPQYRIEPPDVLQIELLKLVPKPPYRIQSYDVLTISALNTFLDQPIQGYYLVEAEGTINLGPAYGTIRVAGMTVEEAQGAIKTKLMGILREPQVSVQLARTSGTQPVTGPYLVAQDGTVNLRQYGVVYVAGKTLVEAKLALEEHLDAYLDSPEVLVDVAAYNSKVYYIITEGGGQGDDVIRLPITGNETVLDAISQIQGLSQLSSKRIWIARPSPAGFGCEQILPVDWDAITRGGMTATNYQLMPGDRVFIAVDPMIAMTTTVSKLIGPFERLLGFSSLSFSTVRSAQLLGVRRTGGYY